MAAESWLCVAVPCQFWEDEWVLDALLRLFIQLLRMLVGQVLISMSFSGRILKSTVLIHLAKKLVSFSGPFLTNMCYA